MCPLEEREDSLLAHQTHVCELEISLGWFHQGERGFGDQAEGGCDLEASDTPGKPELQLPVAFRDQG